MLDGLPARDHCGESDPGKGGKGCPDPCPPLPSRGRTSGQDMGVALTTRTPPVRRAVAPGARGTREAQPLFALSHRTREIRVIPIMMRRFAKASNHNGEGSAL